MSNVPFPWTPTNLNEQGLTSAACDAAGLIPGTMIKGGNVGAGDWVAVFVSYRNTNSTAVVHATDHFLIHVIYTPNSDDAQPHEDQAVTYGGPPNGALGSNRRPNYHIDINTWFQVPFDGQLSLLAGGQSDPNRCVVDVQLRRAFSPRDILSQSQMIEQGDMLNDNMIFALGDEIENATMVSMGPPIKAPRPFPPPVIGTPGLVAATWIVVPQNIAIPFPDGAVAFESVFVNAGALAPPQLSIITLGNPAIAVDIPGTGIPIRVSAFTGGIACTNGTRATWAPNQNLAYATIYSSLGG